MIVHGNPQLTYKVDNELHVGVYGNYQYQGCYTLRVLQKMTQNSKLSGFRTCRVGHIHTVHIKSYHGKTKFEDITFQINSL